MTKWNKLQVYTKKAIIKLNSTQFKLFIVVLGIYLYFLSGFHSANEWSRYALIKAIVEDRTFIIDGQLIDYIDVSYYKGHFYSNKAPGLSFVGVPAYFVARFLISSWWIPYLLISVVALFSSLSVVLVYELARFLGGSKTSRLLTALTYAFGTIAWVYSKTFFAHGFSAFLLLFSMYYARLFTLENNSKFIFLSGTAMGYSVIVDYSNFFFLVPFLGFFLLNKTKKKLIYFLVPVVLSLMILGAYHYVCFGNPFATPYRYHYHGDLQGISAYSNPIHIGIYGLLFSPFRGLFYLSPILLLSLFGFFSLYKTYKPETVFILSSFIIIVLFYSNFIFWEGGWCYGPRYLLPVIPFFTLPLVLVIEKYKDQRSFLLVLFSLLGYSIFANAMGVLVDYLVSTDIKNPLLNNFLYLQNTGGIDSHFFSVSPLTLVFPIIVILIVLVPTFISRLHTEKN